MCKGPRDMLWIDSVSFSEDGGGKDGGSYVRIVVHVSKLASFLSSLVGFLFQS